MPVKMKITYDNDTSEVVHLPVEVWQRGDTWNYAHGADKVIKSVVIDPDKLLPDVNTSNDLWPAAVKKD